MKKVTAFLSALFLLLLLCACTRNYSYQAEEGAGLTKFTIVQLGDQCFKPKTGLDSSAYPGEIVAPTTLRNFGVNPFRALSVLRRLTLACPNFTGSIGPDDFADVRLDYLRLDLPKCPSIGAQSGFRSGLSSTAATDFSEWNLSSLTSLGANFVSESYATGTLKLPRMTKLANNTFWMMLKATGKTGIRVELGAEKPFLSMGSGCFSCATGLRGLSINLKTPELKLGAKCFEGNDGPSGGASNIRELAFTWKIPDAATVSQILVAVPALSSQGDDPCVIYASDFQGAGKLAVPATDADGTPPAVDADAGEKVLGVFVGADGLRKAWVVDRPTSHDGGFMLLVR